MKALYYAKKIIGCFVQYICTFFPIKKSTVLFYSRGGVYSDNSKYISIYLNKTHHELKQVFIISDHQREEFPIYIKKISAGSFKSSFYLSTAQIVFDSGTTGGRGCFHKIKGGKIGVFLHKIAARKRKNQYSISLWHGTPLKKVGYDSLEFGPDIPSLTIADYLIAGCTYTKQCLSSAFNLDIPIKLYGTPRNDVFFDKKIDVDKIKEKLHLPTKQKIILFAPTYRNDVMNSGINQMKEIDFERLFSVLHRKFGGEWCFVFRVHNNVIMKIDTAEISHNYGCRVIDGNVGDDMAEYLLCTDILLTDYSSSMFDFALVKRPCFLLAPDIEHYEKEERGLYINMKELPFALSLTFNELLDNILNFDSTAYVDKINQFLNGIGNAEDGHASERITDDIIHFISTGEKR